MAVIIIGLIVLVVLDTIDAEVRRWQGYDDETVARFGRIFDARMAKRPEICATEFAVCADDVVIGHWMLMPCRSDRCKLECGWWLGPAGRGRGLGREALATVLDYAHRHLGVAVVRMGTTDANLVARRQIEAVGGVLVEQSPHRLPDGSTVDGVWYEHRADDATMAARRAAGAAPCRLNGN